MLAHSLGNTVHDDGEGICQEWLSPWHQPGSRKENAKFCLTVSFSFFSIQSQTPADGATHIQGGFPLIS